SWLGQRRQSKSLPLTPSSPLAGAPPTACRPRRASAPARGCASVSPLPSPARRRRAMCVPPFCHPAHHCLGCLKLKQGAVIVLVGDLIYGICLVALHGVLLGSPARLGEPEVRERPVHSLEVEVGERRLADGAGQGEDADQGNWVFQLTDRPEHRMGPPAPGYGQRHE
ncbi:unnamed protein product, partial [Prorocentrum cordatum]